MLVWEMRVTVRPRTPCRPETGSGMAGTGGTSAGLSDNWALRQLLDRFRVLWALPGDLSARWVAT